MIKNILLVEDNQDNLLYVKNFIKELSIDNLQIVTNYKQALKVISNDHKPDFILCNDIIFTSKQRVIFFEKTKKLNIPLLWIVNLEDNVNKKIKLIYSLQGYKKNK